MTRHGNSCSDLLTPGSADVMFGCASQPTQRGVQMTKSGRHGQRPPGVDGEGARAGYEPPRSDRRLKECITAVDTRAVLGRVRAATEYLPPRIEVLGTIEDLTMGGAIPHPDSSTNMGSVAG